MGSRGRRNAQYRKTAAAFRTGTFPCHLCGKRPGTTVDHVPPLSTFPLPELWVGQLRPACTQCQSTQGATLTNTKRARWRY